MGLLVEQCCVCGQVHRYGDFRPVADYHYHWGKAETEFVAIGRSGDSAPARFLLHRTVCARHLRKDPASWLVLWKTLRKEILPQYVVKGSLNAPLLKPHVTSDEILDLESQYRRMCGKFWAVPINGGKALLGDRKVGDL